MPLDDIRSRLEAIRGEVHNEFEDEHGTHRARLGAIDGALGTVVMHIEHLHDEEIREVELAGRLVQRSKVHGADEVVSPIGRAHEHTLAIAGRA